MLCQLTVIKFRLAKIESLLQPPEASAMEIYAEVDGQEHKGDFVQADKVLKLFIRKLVDKFGNPAKVDGSPQWSLNDDSLGSLEVAGDGMSAVLKFSGKVGTLEVTATADADLGEGVKPLIAKLLKEIEAGEAVSMELGEEELVLEPAPAPAPADPAPVQEPAPAPVEEPAPAPVDPVPSEPAP
jgi:hypothetical protein